MTLERKYSEWRRSWPDVIALSRTESAVEYLQTYYAVSSGGIPDYTGSYFESMAARNTDPNSIESEDFLAVSMLSVNVPADAAIRLLGRDADIVHSLLSEIPIDLDIVDAHPSQLRGDSPAGQLWEVLRQGRDGLGPTTTSKLLAAKRPRLLPIWDSFVERATALGTMGYWQKFQYVLEDDQRRVWDWLSEVGSLATNVPDSISELRILDVLLWMSVESRSRIA
jgi:hypothetical protein